MARKAYVRPRNTVANPRWAYATMPEDLVPLTDDPHGEGERMLSLANLFTITQGPKAGQTFGDVALPWQSDFIRFLFGHSTPEGERIISRAFLKCGKGSGKSLFAAVIALAVLMDSAVRGINNRALIMIVSPTVATSDIVFQHLFEAVKTDKELREQFRSNVARRSITHVESGIMIEIAPAKMDAMVGRRPLMLIVDELHLCATECKGFAAILDQARRGGQNWGGQYLELLISTSPPTHSTGIWAETLDHARKVRDGKLADETFFPAIFEWPLERSDLDPEDATQWWRGMPSCSPEGTMAPRELQKEFEQVRLTSNARDMALLLSQRLGIEPNESRGANQTVLQELWPSAAGPEKPNEHPQAIALDPGGVSDPFAVAFGWRENGNVCLRVKQHLSRKGYDDASDNLRALYDKAIKAGELKLHDTIEALDAAVLEEIRFGYAAHTPLVGGDRYGRAGFVPKLEQELIGPGKFEEVKQGWTLLRAHDATEALLLDGKLRVVQTPLLAANVINLRLEEGPNGRRFAKAEAGLSGAGEHKIDGCMAVLACVEMLLEKVPEGGNDVAWWIA